MTVNKKKSSVRYARLAYIYSRFSIQFNVAPSNNADEYRMKREVS